MISNLLTAAARLSVLLVVAASTAGAADCPAVDPTPARPASGTSYCPPIDRPGTAGLRLFVDRRSGRLRAPTAEEARALIESGGRGAEYLEPIEIVVHPNGMRTVDLKGAFSYELVTRRNADGSFSTTCRPVGSKSEEK